MCAAFAPIFGKATFGPVVGEMGRLLFLLGQTQTKKQKQTQGVYKRRREPVWDANKHKKINKRVYSIDAIINSVVSALPWNNACNKGAGYKLVPQAYSNSARKKI